MINYSIIIPHYNIPDLLGRCLRTIPEREDVQVIVVDDNSPDNGRYVETIPELNRKNVEFYVTKDGLGAGHARNVGLAHAIGKWLVFSDADDFFVDDFSFFLDEYVNDEHDIVYFNVKSCDCYDTRKIIPVDKLRVYRKTGDECALRICYTEPWGKFIRRSLIIDCGITFQETKAHNDLLFSVKVGLEAQSITVIDRPLYWYVIREGSLGHQIGRESFAKICDRARAWSSTETYLLSKGIKTHFHLPVISFKRILPKYIGTFFHLLTFLRKEGMDSRGIFRDTMRYTFIRYFGDPRRLNFYGMLDKGTLDHYKRERTIRNKCDGYECYGDTERL